MLFVKADLAYLTIPFSPSGNKFELILSNLIYLAFDLLNTYATNALPLCWGIDVNFNVNCVKIMQSDF